MKIVDKTLEALGFLEIYQSMAETAYYKYVLTNNLKEKKLQEVDGVYFTGMWF